MSDVIYYLVGVYDNPHEYQEFIMAISFHKNILEDMIQQKQSKSDQFYSLVIRENLKIFQIWLGYDREKLCDLYNLIYIDYPSRKINYHNLYAFNRVKKINNGLNFTIENSIVDLSGFNDKVNNIELFRESNISKNPILFNTYYDEGIMNA